MSSLVAALLDGRACPKHMAGLSVMAVVLVGSIQREGDLQALLWRLVEGTQGLPAWRGGVMGTAAQAARPGSALAPGVGRAWGRVPGLGGPSDNRQSTPAAVDNAYQLSNRGCLGVIPQLPTSQTLLRWQIQVENSVTKNCHELP